jgi:hypothetical protein
VLEAFGGALCCSVLEFSAMPHGTTAGHRVPCRAVPCRAVPCRALRRQYSRAAEYSPQSTHRRVLTAEYSPQSTPDHTLAELPRAVQHV